MAVALGLMLYENVLQVAARHVCSMAGPSPAISVLIAINLPLAIPWLIANRYLFPWSDAFLIVAAGVLWWWVARSVNAWRERRTTLTFKWRGTRLVTSAVFLCLVLICFAAGGTLFAEVEGFGPFDLHARNCFGSDLWFHVIPSIIVGSAGVLWCLWFVILCWRDLIGYVRDRSLA